MPDWFFAGRAALLPVSRFIHKQSGLDARDGYDAPACLRPNGAEKSRLELIVMLRKARFADPNVATSRAGWP